jgi:hypothetical protein
MTALPFSTTIWQWEPETEGSSSLKSLAGFRPNELVPALSLISQAAGDPGWTTSRAIVKGRLSALNYGISNLAPDRLSREICNKIPREKAGVGDGNGAVAGQKEA